MAEEKEKKSKAIDFRDVSICEATIQMLQVAAADGVDTAFQRAADMKACPNGADSACCKHCFMGPCRLNSKDPYSKVGVCGATIDTIASRNFARMVACGGAAHTDHGMAMLDLFRDVVNGKVKDYQIKDEVKLVNVAKSKKDVLVTVHLVPRCEECEHEGGLAGSLVAREKGPAAPDGGAAGVEPHPAPEGADREVRHERFDLDRDAGRVVVLVDEGAFVAEFVKPFPPHEIDPDEGLSRELLLCARDGHLDKGVVPGSRSG